MIVPGLGETSLRRIIQSVLDLANGGSNAIGLAPVVLAPGATETEVQDRLCAPASLVLFCCDSAAAADARPYLKAAGAGSFVIGHQTAGAGATLRYEIRRP